MTETDCITVKTVAVKYGRKYNLGNYKSAEIEVTMWADIAEDGNGSLDAVMHRLWTMAKANVEAKAHPLRVKDQEYASAFLGLPGCDDSNERSDNSDLTGDEPHS